MSLDTRWKNPQGSDAQQLYLWAQDLIKELRKGDYLDSVTPADQAAGTLFGRAIGAGTGPPDDLTATQATAILNNFVGDSGAGGTKGLVPAPVTGDAAKFLRGDATWAAQAASPVTPISQGSVSSGTAQVDFVVGSTFDAYELDLINWQPVTDNTALSMRFSQSGSFLSGATDYSYGLTNGATTQVSEGIGQIGLTTGVGNQPNESTTVTVRILRPGVSSFVKSATWFGGGRTGTPSSYSTVGRAILLANTNAIDGVRVFFSTSNINAGYYAFRGIKFS